MPDEIRTPILYRIFGKQEPSDLDAVTHWRWKHRFKLLTTTDYPQEKVIELQKMGFEVLTPQFSSKQAGENSGAFLNSGLQILKEREEKYAILIASGYQENMQFIDPLFSNARKSIDDLDIYFALTKDVHGLANRSDVSRDFYGQRKHIFPSESLAMVKISSMYPLDEEITIKGKLGLSREGIPLGGVELIVTAMRRYSETKIPLGMMAVTTNINRYAGFMPYDWTMSGDGVESAHPVEVTSTREKLSRREETIDAAMKELNMTREDYNKMFEKTYLADEWDFPRWDL